MKKLIALTIALFVLAAGNAFGQTVVENVGVTANVNTTLSLDGTDVEFGSVNAGSVAYVSADAADTRADENASAPVAGSLEITADEEAAITVSWTNASLTDTDGNNATTFTPTVFYDGGEITTGENITFGAAVSTGDLNIGGELAAIAGGTGSFSTGNPSGSPIVFTVQYQ